MPRDIELLTSQVQPSQYITPPILEVTGMVLPTEEGGPIRIHLILEGGYELELPATQDAIDALHH